MVANMVGCEVVQVAGVRERERRARRVGGGGGGDEGEKARQRVRVRVLHGAEDTHKRRLVRLAGTSEQGREVGEEEDDGQPRDAAGERRRAEWSSHHFSRRKVP